MSTPEPPNKQKLELMFLGEYDRSLDDKGRITLPAIYREILEQEGAILTRGLDRCLVIFPRPLFDAWRDRIRALPITDGAGRNLRRLIFSGAAPVTPDGQGRINIPAYLRQYANLQGAVIVAGSDSYIEIWDAEAWSATRANFEENGDDAAAWSSLGI